MATGARRMTERLDALTLPLHGSRLIEASAGTGKTWTIAALYLRLVLGHGDCGARAPAALGPAQILVMTFTRAATRELAERIRARLIEAARVFRGDADAAPGDDFLRALLADHADAAVRARAAYRLALAAEAMDEAAVHTIDAWCQRMLREHAFDSGSLFSEELVADEAVLRTQAVRDVWRREVYPLAGAALEALAAQWPDVDALQRQIEPLLRHDDLLGDEATEGEAASLAHWLPDWIAARRTRLAALKAGWAERGAALIDWISAQQAGPKPPFNGNKVRADSLAAWRAQIIAWANDPAADALVLRPDSGVRRLSPDGIVDALKKGASVVGAIPADFAAFEALLAELQTLAPLGPRLLRHAARRVGQRLDQLKRRAAQFGFADLQRRLMHALDGPGGERLRAGIRAQYPVVLIDEFQDTSPLQFRLFDRLHDVAANDPSTALLLIGDPKQSIYGFRGADIYSYLKVRRATVGRHYALATNFRSTAALVGAVNTVFAQAEARWPGGAFGFDKAGALALPFEPVAARGRDDVLVGGPDGAALAALQVGWLPAPRTAEALRETLAAQAAARIVGWLDDPTVGFRRAGGALQRLAPGDIAVLVRSRREADAVRAALRRCGVASVYLSDQDSVFRSAEAADLLRWLQAVAAPQDTRLARAAFATATVGLSLDALAQLVHDDLAWDARLAQLQALRRVWQRQGVLTLVRQTLHQLDLPARWLSGPQAPIDGERRLTNLLHLGELLQAASSRLEGEQAQIRWLAEQIHAAGQPGDERIVRLESDAELVQVVTVHKSKGLEYPVVLLPFAAAARPVDRRERRFVERVDAEGERWLDFTLDDEALAEADRERLREDLRLLYVALTRARQVLWLGVGLARQGQAGNRLHQSALGYLLGGGRELSPDAAAAALAAWQDAPSPTPGAIAVTTLADGAAPLRLARRAPTRPLAEVPPYAAGFDRQWAVGSFSALVRDLRDAHDPRAPRDPAEAPVWDRSGLPALLADPRREAQLHEEWSAQAVDAPPPTDAAATPDDDATAAWHRFPRGALAGNFLHELLQMLAEEGFARGSAPAVQALVRRRCERAGHAARADAVIGWIDALLATPLAPLGGATLRDVRTRLPEMEFWMPSRTLPSAALDALCRRHLLPGAARPALVPRQLDGMLMGFADLVFAHGGRWWVLDYKSNHLGEQDADYDAPTLARAVLDHRYELQAALYLLALHRLLRQRLGDDYAPARHLGGALVLFLRGVRGPVQGCVHLPASAALLEGLDACLDGPEVTA